MDAAFAVHKDMRWHTYTHISLGQGTVVDISTKQKVNTWSAAKSELVGANDPLSMILWSPLFAIAQ